MINPNKHVRKAFVDALAGIGLPVFDMLVPANTVPVPETYILLTSQTKQRQRLGRGCDVWDCTMLVDIVSVQAKGYASRAIVDDAEELVLNAVKLSTMVVSGFDIFTLTLESSDDISTDTDTQSIYRQLMRYRFQLEQVVTV